MSTALPPYHRLISCITFVRHWENPTIQIDLTISAYAHVGVIALHVHATVATPFRFFTIDKSRSLQPDHCELKVLMSRWGIFGNVLEQDLPVCFSFAFKDFEDCPFLPIFRKCIAIKDK